MWNFCTRTKPVARKRHSCDATKILSDYYTDYVDFVSECERLILSDALVNPYIEIGQQYCCIRGFDSGSPSVFRYRLDVGEIFDRYDLWPDD